MSSPPQTWPPLKYPPMLKLYNSSIIIAIIVGLNLGILIVISLLHNIYCYTRLNHHYFFLTFQILEFFGTGTAAVISPVSSILYEGEHILLPTMDQPAPLYSRLYNAITDIQYGKISHPWSRVIDERPHLYNSQNYKYANWQLRKRSISFSYNTFSYSSRLTTNLPNYSIFTNATYHNMYSKSLVITNLT